MILVGIIMMTIYITKSQNIKQSQHRDSVYEDDNISEIDAAYSERVSKKFNSMFSDNPAWLNKYQAIDNVQKSKLYN
jgi:hypothetical protein